MTTICPYSVTGRVCELNDDVDRLTRDLAEAKAELAAARKDAERYRFIELHECPKVYEAIAHITGRNLGVMSMRLAIDSARGAG